MSVIWCDGEFLEEKHFRISPRDRGLCHGLSFFETILAVNGQPKLLPQHLGRLQSGLDRLGVSSVAVSEDGLESGMRELLRKNDLTSGHARIRLTLSLGEGALNDIDSGKAWAWMSASEVSLCESDQRVTMAPWRRDLQGVLRGLKMGSYAEHLFAADLARREGYDEVLFLNTEGELCEASMANVFLIKGKKLFTPPLDSGCLPGITRALVLKIASELGISCFEKSLSEKDLARADGLFLTSSIKGPVWVSALGNKQFSRNQNYLRIRERWKELMA